MHVHYMQCAYARITRVNYSNNGRIPVDYSTHHILHSKPFLNSLTFSMAWRSLSFSKEIIPKQTASTGPVALLRSKIKSATRVRS